MSAEAAELHSLLQTGKLERQSQLHSLEELRGASKAQLHCLEELRTENSTLLQRVAHLDAKNDDQEKMLASVLARGGGGRQQQWQPATTAESGIQPHSPRPEEAATGGEHLPQRPHCRKASLLLLCLPTSKSRVFGQARIS